MNLVPEPESSDDDNNDYAYAYDDLEIPDTASQQSGLQKHWRRFWRIGLGTLLVIVGIALCVLPGPGLLTIIAGLAVMADEVPLAHRLLQKLKAHYKQAESAIRRDSKS